MRWQSVAMWWLLWLAGLAECYIPALPTNNTGALISNSADFVQLSWQTNGSPGIIKDVVSRQLVSDATNASIVGVNYGQRGALVHFTEANATMWPPSVVPWVALINCDSNGTVFTLENDIFTMARDGGATAALLYTLTSQACVINTDYLINFQKPLDVYTTTNLQTARLIENQFSSVPTYSYWFNSGLLNNSASVIWNDLNNTEVVVTPSSVIAALSTWENSVYSAEMASNSSVSFRLATMNNAGDIGGPTLSITETGVAAGQASTGGATSSTINNPTGEVIATATQSAKRGKRQAPAGSPPMPTSPGPGPAATPTSVNYLIAVVGNADASYAAASASATGAPAGSAPPPGSQNTSLAMIILYAITGCVTLLFLIVILSGAVRAIRNPERYGPRARGIGGRPAQSRAGGISRAILDSIPLVRYSRNNESSSVEVPQKEDEEIELGNRRHSEESMRMIQMEGEGGPTMITTLPQKPRTRRASTMSSSTSKDAALVGVSGEPSPTTAAPPDADDQHSCPICLFAFEEGEDMRILPCDGRHRFHKECIDPWLLNVSSLCPLCRWDVTMKRDGTTTISEVTEEPQEDSSAHDEEEEEDATLPTQSRFRRAFTHQRESTTGSGAGFTPTRFSRYLTQVRAAARSAGAVGRRNSARVAARAVVEEPGEMFSTSPSS